ncbi:MAG: isoleucine--tRNA ligase, partial [Candidatus Bipolaricaulia bacterium]
MKRETMYPVEGNPDFVTLEHRILDFWKKHRCFDKLQEKNREGPIFRFLDGPITANNPMGVHHAWGRTLKDVFLRYKAMHGFTSHWQNGFDSQGLWVEVEVERELGFNNKREIEKFGVENFIRMCKERVENYSRIQTAQSIRLGQWMDWGNSYYTHTDANIEGIWHFLKKCHANGWIYQDYRLLPWCPRCGTSLSEHEMAGSYRDIEHLAVFAKLPVLESESHARILVWTTTPWTLAANVALAVRSDIDYCEVRVEDENDLLILARDSVGVLKDRRPRIERVFKGTELVGLRYETCFPDLLAQQDGEHRILPWEMVDPQEGTGVVHIAPGCGAEDFELAQVHELPVIQPVDESGVYVEGFDWLTGKNAQDVAELVVDHLQTSGKLFKSYLHKHSYPVCWRCKTETIFRPVNEWFIRCNDIRHRLLETARTVLWQPEHIGRHMEDWLNNMGDWNISRKRFYGLPLPFYPCESCGELTVVGSKDELRRLGGSEVDKLPELHRPWIDKVRITCPQCGARVSRVPEVGDVWLDAGIVPYTTLGYFDDRERWQKYCPAEWITEMREQVRLWFYSMLFMSVTLHDRAPYERVLAHESVVAEDGTRFSKTGHMIHFDDAAEQMGVDVMRYLFCGASPANPLRFGYGLGNEARRRLLSLWNVYNFFVIYARLDLPEVTGFIPEAENLTVTDRWLLARTHAFLQTVTDSMNAYSTPEVIQEFEAYVDDLSNWYVRVNRRRFWKSEDSQDKRVAYWCFYTALCAATQVMTPIIPFMTEEIWQNAIRPLNPDAPISVHLSDWPEPFLGWSDDSLLEQTDIVRKVIGLAHRLRTQKQLKVRQPLLCLYIITDKRKRTAIETMSSIVAGAVNVKSIRFLENQEEVQSKDGIVMASEDSMTIALDTNLTESLILEGLARDLVRHIQVLRKDAGLRVEEHIVLC